MTNDNNNIGTSRVHIKPIDHGASEIYTRNLAPIVSDEKPWNGGKDRGPSPLEYILAGLGA